MVHGISWHTFVCAAAVIAGSIFSDYAHAVSPADFWLREGDLISGPEDPDIYIINNWGYKRLFLNPEIFNFYGHLGGWGNVKNTTPDTRDAFITSGLFQNCEANDSRVYAIEVTGEDGGVLHWLNMTAEQALTEDTDFPKKIFCINEQEFAWYAQGHLYFSTKNVPLYARDLPGGAVLPPTSPTPIPFRTIPNSWPEWLLKEREANIDDVHEVEKFLVEEETGWNSMKNDKLPLLLVLAERYDFSLIGAKQTSSEFSMSEGPQEVISLTAVPGTDLVYDELAMIPEYLLGLLRGAKIYLSTQYGSSYATAYVDPATNKRIGAMIQTYPPDEVTHEFGHMLQYVSIRADKADESTIGKTDDEVRLLSEEFERVFAIPDELPENTPGVPLPGYVINYGSANIDENFAVHFDFYIHSGPAYFRERAANEPLLKEKYEFLKNRILNGVEYCEERDESVGIDKIQPCGPE